MNITDGFDIADKVTNNAKGLFSYIMEPSRNAEAHLIEFIKKNGELKLSDIETAALLMVVRKNVKKIKNNKAIINKANQQFDNFIREADRQDSSREHLNDDWLDYFLDMSQYASDNIMQEIWARILVKEQIENNSVPKSMLNILSMMDINTGTGFTNLVRLSFLYNTGDEAEVVPLIINQYFLQLMREEYPESAHIIDSYAELVPPLFELEKLGDLGLIRMSHFQREHFLYFSEDKSLELTYGLFSMTTEAMRDEDNLKCFLTGQTYYTLAGTALYNTLFVEPFDNMPTFISLFADYQEKHKDEILNTLL